MGPPWEKRQNAYLLREAGQGSGGMSLFYEPHCDYAPESIKAHVTGTVDVLVAPIMNQNLMSYPLVRPRASIVVPSPRTCNSVRACGMHLGDTVEATSVASKREECETEVMHLRGV